MRPGHKHQQQHQQTQRMRGRQRNGKGPNPLTRSFESNGPDVKVRGTAQTIGEKYLQLARDAQGSGDPVAAENYLQHAEHYFRLIADAHRAQGGQGPAYVRPDDNEDSFDEDDEFAPPFMPGAPQPYAAGYNGGQGGGQAGGQPGYANGGGGGQANGQDGGRQGGYGGRPNGGAYRDGEGGESGDSAGRGERQFRGPRGDRQDSRHEPRRDAPRQDFPRQDSPRQDSPRQETRQEVPQDSRQEPRQAPRHEPRQEARHEPRQDPRQDPRQEAGPDVRFEPRHEARAGGEPRRPGRGPRQPYAAREAVAADVESQPIEAVLPSFITGGLQPRISQATPPAEGGEDERGQDASIQDASIQAAPIQAARGEGRLETTGPDGEGVDGGLPVRPRRRRRSRFAQEGAGSDDSAPVSDAPASEASDE